MTDDLVLAPQFGVNDTTATLVIWHITDGAEVTAGSVICELETAKATFEVEAPEDGVVLTLVERDTEVTVNQPLALIGANRDALEARRIAMTAGAETAAPEIVATDKARRLADSLGVDLADLAKRHTGIIRDKDVRAFVEKSEGDPLAIREIGGRLDLTLKRAITDDPAFADLPSEEKVARYRAAGALIGDGVRFGKGAMIDAEAIELADEIEIGDGTRITAETIAMGRMSVIGPRSKVVCRHIRIGDVLFTGSEITIGGADRFSPTDRLIIGDSCLISARCFIDTGHGVRLGDQVGLSPFVKLYTHQHWQNVLEGYRANFGPIIIQDNAYVTGDCLVTPGVRIGAGATVLANSTVAGNVEPETIVSGNPARQVGKVERPLSPERKERIVKRLIDEMLTTLDDRLPSGALVYQQALDLDQLDAAVEVVLTFDLVGQTSQITGELAVFDLSDYRVHGKQGRTSDEVRNFLRRRGIRLAPIHWRYRG